MPERLRELHGSELYDVDRGTDSEGGRGNFARMRKLYHSRTTKSASREADFKQTEEINE